ncbi:hypothetical protein DN752_19475 [Echinicola strongylocentroti]|uniref:Uncharacterized protein n=1 Tax=Echinicola strongylocentroti TaxID=1795355 RepID=A0A2Z4IMT1_9BACT|nr:hypothetical protein [Echinicola strongylocentroti]AWW32144.1 hypothetical protein DN752_19475 [Echinicola strongylocentroti]
MRFYYRYRSGFMAMAVSMALSLGFVSVISSYVPGIKLETLRRKGSRRARRLFDFEWEEEDE